MEDLTKEFDSIEEIWQADNSEEKEDSELMKEDHGQGLEDVQTKVESWGQLDSKHENYRIAYDNAADIG